VPIDSASATNASSTTAATTVHSAVQVVWLDDVMAGDTLEVSLVYPVLVDADAAPANIGAIEPLQTLLESKGLGGDKILAELDHW
jgi:hypothetical protein